MFLQMHHESWKGISSHSWLSFGLIPLFVKATRHKPIKGYFQTLHLFDVIHSNRNKKYSDTFNIELMSKSTRLKQYRNLSRGMFICTRRGLNTVQCVSIAAEVLLMFVTQLRHKYLRNQEVEQTAAVYSKTLWTQ